eukprot:209655_1
MSTEESSQIYIELLDKTIELHKKWFTFINDINNDTINNETQTIILTNQQNNDRINNSIQIKQEFDDDETEAQDDTLDEYINTIQTIISNNEIQTITSTNNQPNNELELNDCINNSMQIKQEFDDEETEDEYINILQNNEEDKQINDCHITNNENTNNSNHQLYECSHCKERLESMRFFVNHNLIEHNDEKPWKCNKCNVSYKSSTGLTGHNNRVHSVKFKCKYCHKTFGHDSILKQHERMHTNEKPFHCHYNNCDKTFKRNVDRRNHINDVHQCKKCGD